MAFVEDPHITEARQQFLREVEQGTSVRTTLPRPELAGRSLHQVWVEEDHEAVLRWMQEQEAFARASAERHSNDPAFMAMLRERQAEVRRRNAERDCRRPTHRHTA